MCVCVCVCACVRAYVRLHECVRAYFYVLFSTFVYEKFVEQIFEKNVIGSSGGAKGGGWRAAARVASLQGRHFRSQMYFYYTNRGVHIYLAPGGNNPPDPPLVGRDRNKHG